ncbi:DUF4870 domain-containing protein [Naasia sp. SYSU D00948]|uniref:DUF4870 domain-containing protein n=1 Tax=Naasia sp. SYSU D00948 TaxID=2817379 RepID=UPI001B311EE1|nr:DUF4870 domain-containing protein [Naasia sp. SYSU D00948]
MTTPPPPPPPQGAGYQPAQPLSPQDQRLWATLTHIGGILFGFIVPLITYLVLKDRGAFVAEHTKTALNFQLTMLIATIIGGVLTLLLIGFLILLAVWVVIIVFSIIAAMKANSGELYQYPLTIKFIR